MMKIQFRVNASKGSMNTFCTKVKKIFKHRIKLQFICITCNFFEDYIVMKQL